MLTRRATARHATLPSTLAQALAQSRTRLRAAAGSLQTQTASASETKLTASDGSELDEFGYAVAIDGNTAVVGAQHDETSPGAFTGSAYVFVRVGDTWTEQAHLTASGAHSSNNFGVSVGISGDTIVVGSNNHDTPTAPFGRAYVFVRTGNAWTLQATLAPSVVPNTAGFGDVVAISGDTIIVHATTGQDQGYIAKFARSGTTWQEGVDFIALDGVDGDRFGRALAISEDEHTIVAGSKFNDTAAGEHAGSVYSFILTGSTWNETHVFASDAAAFDNFGFSVAVSGNTLVVGAPADDTAAGVEAGSVYVFVRDGVGWTEQAHLVASDAAAHDEFGRAVAVRGDVIVSGADLRPSTAGSQVGAVYLFTRSGTQWTEESILSASDGSEFDAFGASVAISADQLLVGTGFETVESPDGLSGGGAIGFWGNNSAYVYSLDADLQITIDGSPNPVQAGATVTYTLAVTNHGPRNAVDVVVSANLPSSLTFDSCLADQGGACDGTGNARTVTFASLPAATTATITIAATVNCSVTDGTTITNSASVAAPTLDASPANNSATAVVSVSHPAPVVTASVATGILQMTNSTLVNVGLTAQSNASCGLIQSTDVSVFGDEDDQTPTSAPYKTFNSPDAKDIALGTLRLRAERVDTGNGRVYLIVVRVVDSSLTEGFDVVTVVAPKNQSQNQINAVNQQADLARAYALAYGGAPPAGYVVIGDGPLVGPKQ